MLDPTEAAPDMAGSTSVNRAAADIGIAPTECRSATAPAERAQPGVTFFVSTARSGTQWIASVLNQSFPELLRAEHEPMGYFYAPARTLRDSAALAELGRTPELVAHFAAIRATMEAGKSYVEVGFPAYALAPLLRNEFGDRLRIAHLTRHPVKVAASLVTHGWNVEDGRRDIHDTVALTPYLPGVTLKHYAERWDDMEAFEKNLFYWYEVNRYGLDLEETMPSTAFARFQMEELTRKPEVQGRFLEFLGLPNRQAWNKQHKRRVDNFRRKTAERIDWHAIQKHPEILALTRRLGYRPDGAAAKELAARYQRGSLQIWGKSVRRTAKRIFR